MDRRLFGLALVTIVLYAPTVSYPYVYEDKNDLEAFSRPWPTQTSDVMGDAVRHPTRLLRDVSFAISGTAPRQAHLGNVVVHLVNGLLVYALGCAWLTPGAGLMAAGVFWLHPVQVESVAYISSRADLVAVLFTLLACLAYRRVWWCLLACLGAVLAKETFVMVLLLPLVTGLQKPNRLLFGVWLALAVPIAIFGLSQFGRAPDPFAGVQSLAQLTRLLLLWVLPIGQTIDHDWALMPSAVVLLAVIAWIALAVVAVLQRWPHWSLALGAIGIFFVPRVLTPLSEGLHEHHLLAPAVALSLWTGSVLTKETT